MAAYKLSINNKIYNIEADPKMPLLWAIRDLANLTGTKYGCGVASCGACTVMMDGTAVYSCQRTVGSCVNKKIITIEGLSDDGSHPVQKAWQQAGVPQCGYCQPGQMMAAAALLGKNKNDKTDILISYTHTYLREEIQAEGI